VNSRSLPTDADAVLPWQFMISAPCQMTVLQQPAHSPHSCSRHVVSSHLTAVGTGIGFSIVNTDTTCIAGISQISRFFTKFLIKFDKQKIGILAGKIRWNLTMRLSGSTNMSTISTISESDRQTHAIPILCTAFIKECTHVMKDDIIIDKHALTVPHHVLHADADLAIAVESTIESNNVR